MTGDDITMGGPRAGGGARGLDSDLRLAAGESPDPGDGRGELSNDSL